MEDQKSTAALLTGLVVALAVKIGLKPQELADLLLHKPGEENAVDNYMFELLEILSKKELEILKERRKSQNN